MSQNDDMISRQAAIDALAKQMPESYTLDGSHPADEEIFMAQEIYADCIETIELLPAVQPELDCISRQAAIDAVIDEFKRSPTPAIRAKLRLEALPSAQPERKKGRWIDKSNGIEGAWNYCSVCGEQAIDLYDFCPNCGADMRGEQDEAD